MNHIVRWPTLALLCTLCSVLALAPGLAASFGGMEPPSARLVYNLYATDGYVRLDDGSTRYIYGFIGGREGETLSYVDEQGQTQTLVEGPPAPAAGPMTQIEAKLAGHAQLPAPVIWAGSNDMVEVRLKNLGGTATGSAVPPLGIEFRGLAVGSSADGAPETSLLAIPANSQVPSAGNLLSYTFRVPRPGTYAYGWSYDSHLAHQGHSDHGDQASGGMDMDMDMSMSCPCMQMAAMSMPAMDMAGMQPTQMDGSGTAYPAFDGALVIYDAADPAAQTGPGRGAGGVAFGMRYDRDFVMLITGGGASQTTQNASYRPFVAGTGQETGHVLVRIINLSAQTQPIEAIIQGYPPAGYVARGLAVASRATVLASWAKGSEARADAGAGYSAVGPGESADLLLDLSTRRSGEPGRQIPAQLASAAPVVPAAAQHDVTLNGSTGQLALQCPMMNGMAAGMTMTGTMQCPMCRGVMASTAITGTMRCPMLDGTAGMQCPMMSRTGAAGGSIASPMAAQ